MERVRVRSDAVLALARYLGGAWRALTIFRLVPRPLRDLAYDVFARHRYRVFGRYSACPIPPPEVRARFLA
jgi:predicted DCC family thiol-disulfide oxidoreductase YuxK